ncbi:MAG: hypothetical protein GY941_14685 [Planctomycetes bacterium]|nr:hypothetical protein [Planctomycetota bacterium]
MKDRVCSDSLALLDPKSTSEENMFVLQKDIFVKLRNGTVKRRDTPLLIPIKSDSDKWYYYPNMTTDEMLVFTHFDSNEFRSVAHGSFTPNYCYGNQAKRKSLESRVLVIL